MNHFQPDLRRELVVTVYPSLCSIKRFKEQGMIVVAVSRMAPDCCVTHFYDVSLHSLMPFLYNLSVFCFSKLF